MEVSHLGIVNLWLDWRLHRDTISVCNGKKPHPLVWSSLCCSPSMVHGSSSPVPPWFKSPFLMDVSHLGDIQVFTADKQTKAQLPWMDHLMFRLCWASPKHSAFDGINWFFCLRAEHQKRETFARWHWPLFHAKTHWWHPFHEITDQSQHQLINEHCKIYLSARAALYLKPQSSYSVDMREVRPV